MIPVEVHSADGPIVLGFPHTGTYIPKAIFEQLTLSGQALSDTDWHVHKLYEGLLSNATTVRATFHRYVIDANRDPSNTNLYPNQHSTALIPMTDFEGKALWIKKPDEHDITHRLKTWHAAYHFALNRELQRVHKKYGMVILLDCHSIRSRLPFLFEGVLPDFNIGTYNSTTCDASIEAFVTHVCQQAKGYSYTLNGRFKGGWTTRHYARPSEHIHTIQMELAQSTYITDDASSFNYDPQKAERLRVHLKTILNGLEKIHE